MPRRWNDLQWDGGPGHYEVHYVTFTDPASGIGFWIRYTMLAPLPETGEQATCSLWLCAMDPSDPSGNVGVKSTLPISALSARSDPFRLRVGDAMLSDQGMAGGIETNEAQYSWDLEWHPRLPAYGHVHPVLRAAKLAKTVLFLPHPDVEVSGMVRLGTRTIEVARARGGQAHLWGTKHATRWAWAHASDFNGGDFHGDGDGSDAFLDGVSVFVPRFGRELGPNTPIVGRFGSTDLISTGPVAVRSNESEFDLTSWRFAARGQGVRVEGTVSAQREDLVGVTYHDPDGELAYCYNTEVADMRLEVFRRRGRRWQPSDEFLSEGRAHFEYAQREPIEGVELKIA
jgi:hypothetical protein